MYDEFYQEDLCAIQDKKQWAKNKVINGKYKGFKQKDYFRIPDHALNRKGARYNCERTPE